jgi:phage tail-like protein
VITETLSRVPNVPAPPHDPSSLLANAIVGWRKLWATNVESDAPSCALRLAPVLDTLPSFANAAGTFGNLTLPSSVTITGDGTLLLLDVAGTRLRRFDRCACAFHDVPGIGGNGAPPRHWKDPRAIAAYRDDLYVCDTGHERVASYVLNGLAFRGDLRPPAATYPHWEPWAIAFNRRGQALVTDRAAGLVHRFDGSGVWHDALTGFSQPTAIAVDCSDRIFVVQTSAGGPEVRVVDQNGVTIDVAPRPDLLAGAFPRLFIAVDSAGDLELGPICGTGQRGRCCGDAAATPDWFDPSGNPLAAPPPATPVIYTSSGEFVSGPFDSETSQCVWHRVVLDGSVPADTKVLVETFVADELYTLAQVQLLATWETAQTARRVDRRWDCLIRGSAGRYLWLRLTLTSMAGPTPRIEQITIEFPRISLRRFLPAIFGAEPVSADFTDRFLALFDTTLRSIERQVDQEARLFDPDSTPAEKVDKAPVDFLTWLGTWVGVAIDRRLPEAKRRQILKRSGRLLDRRGTVRGLRDQIATLIGLERFDRCRRAPSKTRCCPPPPNCTPEPPPSDWPRPPLILEHFKLRRWLWVGAGRLGSEAMLWGARIVNRSELNANAQVAVTQLISTQDPLRDPYHVYAHKFTAFVPCRYREVEADRRALEQLLRTESPAHTRGQLVFVEPRFRIGVQSMIGFDAVVGAVPEGVRLDGAALGAGTVLTAKTGRRLPASLGRARIGTTDRIG